MKEKLKNFGDWKKFILSSVISLFNIKGQRGLGTPLYEALSALMPSVNVDLVCFDCNNRFALVYRADKYYGPGWHVPGGVLRFKETLLGRLEETALKEIKVKDLQNINRLEIDEVFANSRDVRGHFISFLFEGRSSDLSDIDQFDPKIKYVDGQVAMFYSAPHNLIMQHRRYLKFLGNRVNN